MQQRSHYYVTVILVGLLAAMVLLTVFGPEPSAPAKTPTDTFTHVDVTVSDGAIAVTPATVPAGLVEVSVIDNRSNERTGLIVQSPLGVLTVGTQVNPYQALGSYTLRAGHAIGTLIVVAPQLHVARDESTLHVVIRPNDFTAPGREVRREEPTNAIVSGVPQTRDWTAVTAGNKTFIVQNSAHTPETCAIDGLMSSRTVAAGKSVKMSLNFAARPYELRCTTGTFVIWVN